MPRRKDAAQIRVRCSVSPTRHPQLHAKLLALPEEARAQELVGLAAGSGADPALLAVLDRMAAALERLAAQGPLPAAKAEDGGAPDDAPPAALDTDDF